MHRTLVELLQFHRNLGGAFGKIQRALLELMERKRTRRKTPLRGLASGHGVTGQHQFHGAAHAEGPHHVGTPLQRGEDDHDRWAPGRFRAQGPEHVLLRCMHREDEHPDRGVDRGEPARHLEPVQARHAYVEQDHVRVERLGQPQRLLAVAGLARDLDALEPLEEAPDARPHERVVIGNQHADGPHDAWSAFSPTAKWARTSVPPPGALRTSRDPPRASRRSAIP